MESLNEKALKKYLNREFLFFKNLTSTFDVFSDCKNEQADVVVAASQTAGQGRLGRSFFSPHGGIYFCVKTEILPLLTINAAVGVMRAMQRRGFFTQAKWVNDIMLNSKKVCGILAKSDGKKAVIGVGINYCITDFPPEISNKAGSLYNSAEGINEFAAIVISEVLSAVRENNLEFYRSRLYGKGEAFILPDQSKAIILGVSDDGSLIYNKNGVVKNLSYGEIIL